MRSLYVIVLLGLSLSLAAPEVALHGGSYQLVSSTCFVANRFTASCSCPASYDAACFDAVVYDNTSLDVSNTIKYSTSATRLNSRFCLCGRSSGLSTAAVFGGAYQLDDSSDCRHANTYTSSCSCPAGFPSSTSLRSLVFKLSDGALIGSHIIICLRPQSSNAVGSTVTDSTSFSLNTQPAVVQVINNFHGVYAISSNMSSLRCLAGNTLPGIRTSRYLSSIQASDCNCPDNACAASFFWITDELGFPFKYQRMAVCESSMRLPVDPSTVHNKVMLGYQKWQATPKNGFGLGYHHWSRDGVSPMDSNFADHANFDLWPDTSEFPQSNLTATSLLRPDGSRTTLYDAYLPQSIEVHLKWLQYYGLHGVWLQRFFSVDSGFLNANIFSVNQVKKLSESYGRVFGIMWDTAGMDNSNLLSLLQTDIARLNAQTGAFSSSAYVRHQGKPLVGIYGLGVNDKVNLDTATRCVQFLKSSGFAVMAGVPFSWRTQLAASKEDFSSVYNMLDIISPWTVGAYSSPQHYLSFAPANQAADVAYCAQKGISYAPVVFPGSGWTNLRNHEGGAVLNENPRLGGVFWQTQVDSLEASVMEQPAFSHLYLAMYDEFDESTAMSKAAESFLDKPAQGMFLALDADGFHVPNDHYMCLAGREAYRRQQPLLVDFPYAFRSRTQEA